MIKNLVTNALGHGKGEIKVDVYSDHQKNYLVVEDEGDFETRENSLEAFDELKLLQAALITLGFKFSNKIKVRNSDIFVLWLSTSISS